MSDRGKKVFVGVAILILSCISCNPAISKPNYPEAAKNVILLISDGAGFNAFEAANYYQFGEKMPELYRDFPIKIASKTDMLNFIDKNRHPRALVPVFAKGLGADLFLDLVQGADAQAGSFWGLSGQYIDNTDIFTVMEAAMNPSLNPVNMEALTGS